MAGDSGVEGAPELTRAREVKPRGMELSRRAQSIQGSLRRRFVQIDSRHCRFGSFEHDVLHLLHVDVFGFDRVEHLRQHPGAIAMAHN